MRKTNYFLNKIIVFQPKTITVQLYKYSLITIGLKEGQV